VVFAYPRAEFIGHFAQLEKIMRRFFYDGPGFAQRAVRLDNFGDGVCRGTRVARVAVLVGRFALRAGAFDEAVGKEHFIVLAEQLLDLRFENKSFFLHFRINEFGKFTVLFAVGSIKIVEVHVKVGEIFRMLLMDPVYHFFGSDAGVARGYHYGRAVSVVAAYIDAFVADEFMIPDEYIGLNIFDEVAYVYAAVGVGKPGGDYYLSFLLLIGLQISFSFLRAGQWSGRLLYIIIYINFNLFFINFRFTVTAKISAPRTTRAFFLRMIL
jgi:hypothetical protein